MTCFVFIDTLDGEHYLSLSLNAQGQVEAPLKKRTVEEIRLLQANEKTIAVLSAEKSSIHLLELPLLNEHKIRSAIPYALEEEVAQNVSTLHFAFDKQYYQNGQYLVVAIDADYFRGVLTHLTGIGLTFDVVTLDWFALKPQESCIIKTSLLVNNEHFKGALGIELINLYLQKNANLGSILIFNDIEPDLTSRDVTRGAQNWQQIEEVSFIWIAQRLLRHSGINLCQGTFKHDSKQIITNKWYQWVGALLGVWLFSFIFTNILKIYLLNDQLALVDKQIAVVYREFFPEAHQVISPRFRIGEWLKHNRANYDEALWHLLDGLAKTFKQTPFTILQLRYQSQMLTVTLFCSDFATLEKIQSQLQQTGIHVKQLEAATQQKNVKAILELS